MQPRRKRAADDLKLQRHGTDNRLDVFNEDSIATAENGMSALNFELKAKDVMVTEPVCVERATTIRELARILEENEISGAPVVDKQGHVIGVVSKTDLIRRCAEGTIDTPPAHIFQVLAEESGEDEQITSEHFACVEDVMTDDPVTVTANTPASHIARLMFEKRIHRIIVVDHDRFPVGIITSLDLLGVFPN